MGKSSKLMRKVLKSDISSDDDDSMEHQLLNVDEKYDIKGNHTNGDDDDDDEENEDDEDDDDDADDQENEDEEELDSGEDIKNLENDEGGSGHEDSDTDDEDDFDDENESSEEQDNDGIAMQIDENKHADMEELEKEYEDLRHQEQDLFRNIRRDKDEDLMKGQAVKNQRALWDKALEFRFLLQKSFSNSNRLPQEPVRSAFCKSGDGVNEAYSDLIDSTKKTLDSILKLQEALVDNNPSIVEATDGDGTQNSTSLDTSRNSNEGDEEWFQISQMQSRITPFRDVAVDKWQRKTQVMSGAAGIKNKFQAFNQNISEQVSSYMRDPSRMIKGMQQIRSAVPVFGNALDSTLNKEEVINADGDPELLDDSEFYQQLLREFFETVDAGSSEIAFYAMKRLQTKKRKIVDRRASKSRKIRYHVHEKIVNFMAPQPMNIPPMAPKLFENLFGLKTQKSTSVA